MAKRLLLVILFLSSVIGTLCYPLVGKANAGFVDIQGHWAQLCIQQLEAKDIMEAYQRDRFSPNSPVTRKEFAQIVTQAFPQGLAQREVNREEISDRPIRQAYTSGFLQDYSQDSLQQYMTRIEAWTSLAAGLNFPRAFDQGSFQRNLSQAFTDSRSIPAAAYPYLIPAFEQGLVSAYPAPDQLRPKDLITRGELAASICQGLEPNYFIKSEYIATMERPEPPETRGVWLTNVDSDLLYNRRRLPVAIDKLAELNFNTLYPTVWNWGYTLYPSQVNSNLIGDRVYPDAGLVGRDVLQETITYGHRHGMAVIPWFEFGFMAPEDSKLVNNHSSWLTQRSDGSTMWLEGNTHRRVWLNPLKPEVQTYITDLLIEVVTKYDIDGIQLDDHFGYPSDFGYDSDTIKLYQASHSNGFPPLDYADADWIQWRADRITDFMETLIGTLRSIKPDLIISVSPNPQQFSLEKYLLDWQAWERKGLIDELVLQVYRTDNNSFRRELQDAAVLAAKEAISVNVGILSGIKPRKVPFTMVEDQVKIAREEGLAGVSFFFYETLWNLAPEKPPIRQAGFLNLFPSKVERG